MAISSSSGSGINFDGILSGMNTSGIIDSLIALQKAPITQLQKQRSKVASRDSAYQDIRAKVNSFQSTLKSLLMSNSINARSTTSSAGTIATASATADAANGTFTVNVIKMATASMLTGGAAIGKPVVADGFGNVDSNIVLASAGLTTPITTGDFTINGHTIHVDPTVDKWSDVAARITAADPSISMAYGQNSVSLVSSSAMQIGAATDTTNFLSATHLLGAAQVGSGGPPPTTYTVNSNAKLGAASTITALSSANLATAINDNGGTGAFTINGVSVAWTANDSLNAVISRINSSVANVRASYDPTTDKLTLLSGTTGAQNIAVADTSGNFLNAVGLTAGSVQTAGAPAEYTITQNGTTTATQYSNTNSVTNALPGVNLTLTGQGSASITVAQDTGAASRNVQSFVDAFNSVATVIEKYTTIDTSGKGNSGVLAADSTVRAIQSQLRSLVTTPALMDSGAAYKSLADIGITTGAVGSQVGTTDRLTLHPRIGGIGFHIDHDRDTRCRQSVDAECHWHAVWCHQEWHVPDHLRPLRQYAELRLHRIGRRSADGGNRGAPARRRERHAHQRFHAHAEGGPARGGGHRHNQLHRHQSGRPAVARLLPDQDARNTGT